MNRNALIVLSALLHLYIGARLIPSLLDFPAGYGFMGIAVALMGRNHPLGICLAALFFGALYQGGTELSFEMPKMTRDIVVVIEGLAILFCGALENLFRSRIARWLGSEAAA